MKNENQGGFFCTLKESAEIKNESRIWVSSYLIEIATLKLLEKLRIKKFMEREGSKEKPIGLIGIKAWSILTAMEEGGEMRKEFKFHKTDSKGMLLEGAGTTLEPQEVSDGSQEIMEKDLDQG